MNFKKSLWNFIKMLFKLALRIAIILLWGILSLAEVFLKHINEYLKKIIS